MGVNPKINRHVPNAEIQTFLRFNAQLGFKRRKVGPVKSQHPAPKGIPKGRKGKEGNGGAKAVKFTIVEMGDCGPVIEEIHENEVNVATRQINLANALGAGDWEERIGP